MAQPQPAAPPAPELDHIVALGKAVGDRLRAGILQVLHEESYSVTELCQLFEVPQPALSHHLKILHTSGLAARRREGNSIYYRRANSPDPITAAFFDGLDQVRMDEPLIARIERIHAARRRRSEEFFASNAGEIAARHAEISEPEVYTDAVLELLDSATTGRGGQALEVGPGNGTLLARLASRFTSVTGIDSSSVMLEGAASAVAGLANVQLKHLDFLHLPRRRRYDAIVAAMVVHHQASPAGFFQQAAKLLKRSGTLVVAELTRHDQEWASSACGDQWLGFEPADLNRFAARAGLAPAASQFLAQKNGFRLQIHSYLHTENQP